MERREQSRALKDWLDLKRLVEALDPLVIPVLVRGTFGSGQRMSLYDGKGKPEYLEQKTQSVAYSDPTGEDAIKVLMADQVRSYVVSMATNIGYALNAAKQILHVAPQDVVERASREIPNCAACGDPIVGRIRYSRWDTKCYSRFRRWVEAGNQPDEKLRFEQLVQSEIGAAGAADLDSPEWRITAVDVLQDRGELPKPSPTPMGGVV